MANSGTYEIDQLEVGRPLAQPRLSHLKLLEAESIHIFREVAAEFQRPVMLYSIGKDSSVMLRLAQKAFFPGPIPFPLLHIDTGYKFKEMISFRNDLARELGLDLRVWQNTQALANGANPVALGTQRCCGLLKTTALLDGLRDGGFDAAFGGARRDEEEVAGEGANLFVPRWRGSVGPEEPAAGGLESLQLAHFARRKYPRVSIVELDGTGCMALHPTGEHPDCAALFREGTAHD